ncbi:MAG: metal ABC transporter permease [Thermosulfidibacteraceae bacterium]|jgi:zinc transport system permease protein
MSYIPEFLVIPLLVAFISAISLSIVSVFVVLNRWGFLAVGVSHGAFFGVTCGVLLNFSPFLLGVLSGFLLVLSVSIMKRELKGEEDVIIGFLFPLFMALGIIVFSIGKIGYIDAFSYLFGSIFLIDESFLLWSIVVFLITILFVAVKWREIFLWVMNEEMATSLGVNSSLIYLSLLLVTTMNTVLAMKTLGAILVSAFAVMPGLFAVMVSRSIYGLFLSSIIYAFITFSVGILVAFYLDLPTGPVITVAGFLVLLLFSLGIKFKDRRM